MLHQVDASTLPPHPATEHSSAKAHRQTPDSSQYPSLQLALKGSLAGKLAGLLPLLLAPPQYDLKPQLTTP